MPNRTERTFYFPDKDHRNRFMGIFDHYTGWRMENFFPDAGAQRGRLLVHQSFGPAIWMSWEADETGITFDSAVLEANYAGDTNFHVWRRIDEYAQRFKGSFTRQVGSGRW